jgi:DNA-directed RNA polymerase subunit M/transcription elongation factor TFIIS
MFIIYKPDEFRENIVNKITEIINYLQHHALSSENNTSSFNNELSNSSIQKPSIADTSVTKLPKNIEKGVYNYAIKEATNRKIIKKWENKYFVQLYIDRLKTVFVNLKTTPLLVNKLVNGEITPEIFAYMTHQEMRPDQWNDLIALKIKRDESKYVNRVEASTDIYQCRKCKSRKCTYYSVQVRSADEPMSVFITCSNCSHNFRD